MTEYLEDDEYEYDEEPSIYDEIDEVRALDELLETEWAEATAARRDGGRQLRIDAGDFADYLERERP